MDEVDANPRDPGDHGLPFPLSAKGERRLTMDWGREISLNLSNHRPYLYIYKGDSKARPHNGFVEYSQEISRFCTGSTHEGSYNSIGFGGHGDYTYPHGVRYEGMFRDGQFHGEGTLVYPMGQKIDGIWHQGKLMRYRFRFSDGLVYTSPWRYCQQPDRRFQSEILDSLHPAGNEFLTNAQPTKDLKEGCYDTVDGFFDPRSKCVYKDEYIHVRKDGKTFICRRNPDIIRVVTKAEEDIIEANYRKAADEPVEYRSDLYEYWTSGKYEEVERIMELERKESVESFTVLREESTDSSSDYSSSDNT